ncbi:hypothetical protein BB561_001977 [Smittium simulii]|uniref:Phosphatidic acid phosphatase type 2/haloperoxidase domain-containing protein n=1 Tax=Smittium simulii TaxID=133385 RepID=A0A2T9YSG4_9FUNG|nr:hypothetical protein BB561_001977 [Smittium simulii]
MLETLGFSIHYLPYFIVITQGLALLFTRRLYFAAFLGGQVINELINNVLKKMFKQPRPSGKGMGYGMPSAHAQFFTFLFFYLISNIKTKSNFIEQSKRVVAPVLFSLLVLVCWSRVYHGYHTLIQVLVGVSFGVGFSYSWTHIVASIITSNAFSWLIQRKYIMLLCLNNDLDYYKPATSLFSLDRKHLSVKNN